MDAQHYLVCAVRTNEAGQEEASLDGFIQNCDLRAAQQYFAQKKLKTSKFERSHSHTAPIRLFQLVEVKS